MTPQSDRDYQLEINQLVTERDALIDHERNQALVLNDTRRKLHVAECIIAAQHEQIWSQLSALYADALELRELRDTVRAYEALVKAKAS